MSKEIKDINNVILRVTQNVVVHTPNYSKFGGYEGERDIYTMDIAKGIYKEGYRKQSEWISVEDRLPKQWQYVLVFDGFEIGTDFIASSGMWYEHDHKDITHWMPLPEPPKKGGAE